MDKSKELATLYQAFSSGQRSPLPELPVQYADFAVWQRQWLQGEVVFQQLYYWKYSKLQPPFCPAPNGANNLEVFPIALLV